MMTEQNDTEEDKQFLKCLNVLRMFMVMNKPFIEQDPLCFSEAMFMEAVLVIERLSGKDYAIDLLRFKADEMEKRQTEAVVPASNELH